MQDTVVLRILFKDPTIAFWWCWDLNTTFVDLQLIALNTEQSQLAWISSSLFSAYLRYPKGSNRKLLCTQSALVPTLAGLTVV